MLISWRKTMGFTLLETMLVLVIASSILIMVIRQSQTYTRDANVIKVKTHIDDLFQAASYYYQANCRNNIVINAQGVGVPASPSTAALDVVDPSAISPYLLTTAMLMQTGHEYLSQAIIPVSSIEGTYIIQLNALAPGTRTFLVGGVPHTVGTIHVWSIQVSLLISNPTAARRTQYQRLLTADCTSTLSGSTVLPCSAGQPGNYLVWERLPSSASLQAQSPLWPTNATVMQFQQMYTTGPVNAQSTSPTATQNFLCGS